MQEKEAKQPKGRHDQRKEQQQDQEMQDHDETAAAADSKHDGHAAAEQKRPVVFTDEHTVFVKGLGYDVSEEDLQKLFAPAGGLRAVRMGKDRDTGAPRVRTHQ